MYSLISKITEGGRNYPKHDKLEKIVKRSEWPEHMLRSISCNGAPSLGLLRQTRGYITSLYLGGDKAKEHYAVLTPFMDFKGALGDPQLERSIRWRSVGLERLQDVRDRFKVYSSMKEAIARLESQRESIVKQIRAAKPEESYLKARGKQLREELKGFKEKFYPVESDFICRYLELPNYLHEKTPQEHSQLLYRNGLPQISKETGSRIPNHLDRKDLIDFTDKFTYYLLDDAANFDWEFPQSCVDMFLKNNFTAVTCPDFSRSVLVEAALIPKEKAHEVVEEDNSKINTLHLTGGGSLLGFLGYIAKLSIYSALLPLKLVTSGRKYSEAKYESSHLEGLYSTVQSNVVEVFIAAETSEKADLEMETALNLIVDIYKDLGLLFRIQHLPAPQLELGEALRASIQVYSPKYEQYIEVGSLSHYSDFISKRLLFNVSGKKGKTFPHIVSGTVVDVTKIIACLIENGKPTKVVRKSICSDKFEDIFSVR